MILDRPNHFCKVPIIFYGYNWLGRNRFGQVQIIKSSPEKSNLNLTKMIWTRPKQFGPIEGQGIRNNKVTFVGLCNSFLLLIKKPKGKTNKHYIILNYRSDLLQIKEQKNKHYKNLIMNYTTGIIVSKGRSALSGYRSQ